MGKTFVRLVIQSVAYAQFQTFALQIQAKTLNLLYNIFDFSEVNYEKRQC